MRYLHVATILYILDRDARGRLVSYSFLNFPFNDVNCEVRCVKNGIWDIPCWFYRILRA